MAALARGSAESGQFMLRNGPWLGLAAAVIGLCWFGSQWFANRRRPENERVWSEGAGVAVGYGIFFALFTLAIAALAALFDSPAPGRYAY